MRARDNRGEAPSESARLLRIPLVAQELDCASRTVWRLIQAGELVSVRIGRRGVRVDRESLDAFIARRGVQG